MDFGDGPDGFDPNDMTSEEEQLKMVEKQAQMQLERAKSNPTYVDRVLGMCREAVKRGTI